MLFLVFCDKKIMVDEVFNFLDSKNVFCVSIHGILNLKILFFCNIYIKNKFR